MTRDDDSARGEQPIDDQRDPVLHRRCEREVERIRAELKELVRRSRVTQKELAERNGYQSGYLSRVLNGQITLSMRHVLGVLLALEVSPVDFFRRLGDGGTDLGLLEIGERMARYDAAFEELGIRLSEPGADSSTSDE